MKSGFSSVSKVLAGSSFEGPVWRAARPIMGGKFGCSGTNLGLSSSGLEGLDESV